MRGIFLLISTWIFLVLLNQDVLPQNNKAMNGSPATPAFAPGLAGLTDQGFYSRSITGRVNNTRGKAPGISGDTSGHFVLAGANTAINNPLMPATTPSITVGAVTGTISACVGAASSTPAIQQFSVAANTLTGNITATAPTDFEISLTVGGGYASIVAIPESDGAVTSTTIYVRSAATAPAGPISGDVTLTSPGVPNQSVAVNGTVNALPTVNAVSPQTVNSGAATSAITFAGTGSAYLWTNNTPAIGLPASGSGNIPSFTATNTGISPVTATITVTPVSAEFAYISNTNSNNVSVINTQTNTVVATIPVGSQPQNVWISPDNSRVYVANSSSNNVSVINTASNTVIATIPVGSIPQAITVSRDGKQVYVSNLFDNTVSVINTATNTVKATISDIVQSFGLAASPTSDIVFAANTGNTISVINTATNVVQQTITVGNEPLGIVVSPDGSRLYVNNSSDNTVSVVNTANFMVVNTFAVGNHPNGICISPDGNILYVSCYFGGVVMVIDAASGQIIQSINMDSPSGMSVTADGSELYVATNPPVVSPGGNPNVAEVISTATNTVTATVPVGLAPNSFGNFIAAGPGCSGTPTTFTITVNPISFTMGAVTGSISACEGTASVSPNIEQFTVSTTGLTGNVTATAPTGFEVSLSASSGYSSSVTITQTGSTVVYVRSAATAPAGNISGSVTAVSAGSPNQTVPVTGTIAALPTVNIIAGQTVISGSLTTEIDFTGTGTAFNWTNDAPGIGLPASGSGNITPFIAINSTTVPRVATITVTPAMSGFAYVADGGSNTISLVDTKTNTAVSTISVGSQPYGVSVSPDGSKVYVTNELSSSVSVISTSTNTVTATINVGLFPISVTESPDGTTVYVVNDQSNTVSAINTSNNTVVATIPVGTQATGIAISPDGNWLYVSSASLAYVSVISTAKNTVTATIPVGQAPGGLAVSPDGGYIYVANANSNTVSVISRSTNKVIASIGVGSQPFGIAISADGNRIYAANSVSGSISVIDAATRAVVATIKVGSTPYNVSVSPDGVNIYAINNGDNTVSVINSSTNTVTATIPVGKSPGSFGNFIASRAGCGGTPVSFTITVTPGPAANISIPNTFTPNGDGINDTWDIKYLNFFPQCSVQVFTRWGKNVFTSIGYNNPWNGSYGGSPLPVGTYYYVISLNNNTPPLAGFVALIR